jgi:hypothetical protein
MRLANERAYSHPADVPFCVDPGFSELVVRSRGSVPGLKVRIADSVACAAAGQASVLA